MEVFVSAPSFSISFSNVQFPDGSAVRDLVDRFALKQGVSDFYVTRDGRLSDTEDSLQRGAVYHLEPRLCGGKGGFGSMLRALGAQIEKTTNREACRDLSGRRLRDVNHEKEMGEWLSKQSEREAEKEQRRADRLQRKLAEPKHQFTDRVYQQQCHDLSERLEDSVIKGLQASCSGQVKVDEASAAKRQSSEQRDQPLKKRQKKKNATAGCMWTGVGDLVSSEDDDDSPSTSGSRSSSAGQTSSSESEAEKPSAANPSSAPSLTQPPSSSQSERENPPAAVTPSQEASAPCLTLTSSSQSERENPPAAVTPSQEASAPCLTQQTSSSQSERENPPAAVTPSEEASAPCLTPPSSSQSERENPPAAVTPSEEASAPCLTLEPVTLEPIELSSMASPSQLEALGLDVLKKELMCRGLKCGGTLSERATRLFSVKGLSPDQIDAALLAKPAKNSKKK